MTKHWVVLETGGNQDYIFDSNRMRHVVGASQLVLEAGTTWVEEACAALPDPTQVEQVQLVSGKAVLLVPTEDLGRAVIRAVSERALRQAPGLEVTGVVGPAFDESALYVVGSSDEGSEDPADHVAALRRTFIRHGLARAARPARQLRDQVLPWHELCRETSLPACGWELFGDDASVASSWHEASDATLARTRARRRPETQDRLRELLGSQPDLLPEMVDDLTEDGWIAVVHADGNGVGTIFHDFPDRVAQHLGTATVSTSDHATWLRQFSERLEGIAREAFTTSVGAAVAEVRERTPTWLLRGRLLPVLLGGDDVTFACHAALALPLVRAFLREFARLTGSDDTIRAIEPAGLTASAGVAIVKRHHPFSAAYDLAEDLTRSAKVRPAMRLLPPGQGVSAYDVHVAHESTLRPLRQLRAELTLDAAADKPVDRHAGPYVITLDTDTGVPDPLAERDERHLLALLDLLTDGTLSSARAHDLRGALDRGPTEYRSRVFVAMARTQREHLLRSGSPDQDRLRDLLKVVEPTRAEALGKTLGSRFVRLPDALLLHGVMPRAEASQPRTDARAAVDVPADDEVVAR